MDLTDQTNEQIINRLNCFSDYIQYQKKYNKNEQDINK